MGYQCSIVSHSPEQTVKWGKQLGELLEAGDVVALVGELGAGKTTLARGIARGLGVDEHSPVVSPTFTLINEYQGRIPLYHLDFYRLDCPGDCASLGLEEYFCGEGVALIEWADKMETLLPDGYLLVKLAHVDDQVRQLEISGRGDRALRVVGELSKMI